MKSHIIFLCLIGMTAMGLLVGGGCAEKKADTTNSTPPGAGPKTPAQSVAALPPQPTLESRVAVARTNGSATVLLPAGEYRIDAAIDLAGIRRVQGEGDVRIVQTRPDQPVFINREVSRLYIGGLTFIGGRDQLTLGAPRDAESSVVIKDCRFTGARGTAVRFLPGSDRLMGTLQYCTFTGCAQVLESVGDLTHLQGGLIMEDRTATGPAAIINHGALYLDDVRALKAKDVQTARRYWIENFGYLNCRNCVFGEPEAGRTVVVHRSARGASGLASLTSGARRLWVGLMRRKTTGAGPGPVADDPTRVWTPGVTLDTCHLYTREDVAVECESLPEALTVVKCVGLTDQTLMRLGKDADVSAGAGQAAPIRLWIGQEQGLSPDAVPDMLRPYLQGCLAADGTEALEADGPPGGGDWRRGQLLINRCYQRGPEVEPYGWYCVESGNPGRWRAVRFSLTDGPVPTNTAR